MGYRISGRLELHVIRELDRVQHGMHISRLGKHMVQQSSKLFRRRAFGVGNLFNHEEPRRATYRGKVIIKLRGSIRRRAGQHLHHYFVADSSQGLSSLSVEWSLVSSGGSNE